MPTQRFVQNGRSMDGWVPPAALAKGNDGRTNDRIADATSQPPGGRH